MKGSPTESLEREETSERRMNRKKRKERGEPNNLRVLSSNVIKMFEWKANAEWSLAS